MMRRYGRKLQAVFLACAVALMSASWNAGTAYAAGSTVSYQGGAEDFVFLSEDGSRDTDLFDSFKNVMPGDTLTQNIYVRNDFGGADYVKIYLKAETHDGSVIPEDGGMGGVTMSDFLSKLSMKVYQNGKLICDASPAALDSFKTPVYLGSFDYKESTVLNVELHVPIELGNEYANRIGVVDWIFYAEEQDYDDSPADGGQTGSGLPGGGLPGSGLPGDGSPGTEGQNPWLPILPKTGDMMSVWPYLLLLLAGVCGLVYTIVRKKKKDS